MITSTGCMKFFFTCSILVALQAQAQDVSRVALLPNIAGYDTNKSTVEKSDLAAFDDAPLSIAISDFVSPNFLPELGSLWILSWGENIGWFPLGEVYRGDEVLDAWIDTLEYGVRCIPSESNYMPFLNPLPAAETCAYTVTDANSEGVPSIIYCVFWRVHGVDSERECEVVAELVDGDERVLAVTEGQLPNRGAGGEAFWYCVLPGVSPETAAKKILELLESLTEGGGVRFVNDIGERYLVGAQAMNLSSYHDDFFVKLSLMGDITDLKKTDASYASAGSTGFTASDIMYKGSGSMFAFYRSFTVSPRVTSSVIDYREPSSTVEEQVWNAYSEKMLGFYETNFPGYECQFFLI